MCKQEVVKCCSQEEGSRSTRRRKHAGHSGGFAAAIAAGSADASQIKLLCVVQTGTNRHTPLC